MLRAAVLIVVAVIALLPGCSGGVREVRAHLGEEFTLRVGETASVVGESLKVAFDKVSEDSRCPRNATCIWAGRVGVTVRLTNGGPWQEMTLTQPGFTDDPVVQRYQSYRLTFRIEPYPEAGKSIPADEYRLVLTVDR